MIDILTIVDRYGDILATRNYKGDASYQQIQAYANSYIVQKRYMDIGPICESGGLQFIHILAGQVSLVATSNTNPDCCLMLEVLRRFSEILRSYANCVILTGKHIRDHLVIVYELMDEILDFGYPQIMETKLLKMYITTHEKQKMIRDGGTSRTEDAIKQITVAATGVTSWRTEGIAYEKNSLFIDVVEKVNVVINANGQIVRKDVTGNIFVNCLLSGVPECKFGFTEDIIVRDDNTEKDAEGVILENLRFHQSVRLAKFDQERVISFIPPDGLFELMSYRMTNNISFPFEFSAVVTELNRHKLDIDVRLESKYLKKLSGENVTVTIPLPPTAISFKAVTRTIGKADLNLELKSLTWKIKKFQGGCAQHQFKTEVTLMSTINDDGSTWVRPPIVLSYTVPMLTASGLRVRYLRVQERNNYKPTKWIRYVTKAGEHHHRI